MAIGLPALRAQFPALGFEEAADGVLEMVIAHEGRQNSATEAMHRDLANVWRAVDAEPGIRAVLVRGAGEHFSSGGDFAMIERMIADEATLIRVWREASDLVFARRSVVEVVARTGGDEDQGCYGERTDGAPDGASHFATNVRSSPTERPFTFSAEIR